MYGNRRNQNQNKGFGLTEHVKYVSADLAFSVYPELETVQQLLHIQELLIFMIDADTLFPA